MLMSQLCRLSRLRLLLFQITSEPWAAPPQGEGLVLAPMPSLPPVCLSVWVRELASVFL